MLLHQTFVKTEFLSETTKTMDDFLVFIWQLTVLFSALIGSKGTDASKVTIALLVLHLS
jgi:hypothetical protein